jgi:hypothetical protein
MIDDVFVKRRVLTTADAHFERVDRGSSQCGVKMSHYGRRPRHEV